MNKCYPLVIEGKDIFSDKKQTVYEKSSGNKLTDVSLADNQHIEMAIEAAENAKQSMAELPAHRKSKILRRAAEIIREKSDIFCNIIIQEAGKPYKFSRAEVERCIENIEYAAEEAKRIHGETLPLNASKAGEGRTGYYERFPLGIILAISPFNFPLNLAAHKIAPAIAAGCPVIFKPSSFTPITGIELTKAFVEAGLPPGGIAVLVGPGQTVGNKLVGDNRISKVSFTGSKDVGELIAKTAGLKKITMELGSNSGVVIDDNIINMDYAVKRCVLGAFYYQGQVCISVQRIYVHKKNYHEFIEKFIKETNKLKSGNPLNRDVDIGPIISLNEANRIEKWVKEALANGARLLTGGKRQGNLYQPTVLVRTSSQMKVMKDEIFGPVVSINKINDFEEGISLCDNSKYGLQAGIFTGNISKALKSINRLNVGGVIINDIPSFRVDHMPYGGNKGSGLGREGAKFAIEEMTAIRMVVFNLNE